MSFRDGTRGVPGNAFADRTARRTRLRDRMAMLAMLLVVTAFPSPSESSSAAEPTIPPTSSSRATATTNGVTDRGSQPTMWARSTSTTVPISSPAPTPRSSPPIASSAPAPSAIPSHKAISTRLAPRSAPPTASSAPSPGPFAISTPAPTSRSKPAAAGPVPGFVYRAGTKLMLNGRGFRFTGLNIYNANSRDNCWYSLGAGGQLDRNLIRIGPGQEVFRAWFFQRLATRNGRRDWTAFDHTLKVARAHNQRVIDARQPVGRLREQRRAARLQDRGLVSKRLQGNRRPRLTRVVPEMGERDRSTIPR